jgi:hypothetical protein
MRTVKGIPLIVAAVAAVVATVGGPPSLAQAPVASSGGPRPPSVAQVPLASPGAPGPQETASSRHERGVNFHLERRLDEAAREYAQALALDPPRIPGADERATILRFAPRVFTTPDEIFPLKDAAAVLHPSERLIAYHLFWEDDIDFPDDNDPSDHELVWVQFSPDRQSVERFWTYFHGRFWRPARRLRDASLRDAAARQRNGVTRIDAVRMGIDVHRLAIPAIWRVPTTPSVSRSR